MEIVFYISCAIFGLGMGYLIAKTSIMKNCKHSWKVIQEGEMRNIYHKGVTGYTKVYECEHCQALKKERINY